MSEQLDAALALARLGYAVFPCRDEPNDKSPLTRNGFKDATTEEAMIRAMWRTRPTANVGVRTGKLENGGFVAVIDVDGDAGADSLAKLQAQHGELPKTLRSSTRRGTHLYFLSPRSLGNSAGKLAPGIDVRGDGGYAIAPPGKGRAWDVSPSEQEPAELPDWLTRRLEALARPSQDGSRPHGAYGERIPHGQRNATLASLAGWMRRRGVSPDAIGAALIVENAARCEPPLPEGDVRRIAASVGRYEPAQNAMPGGEVRAVTASTVAAANVRWLWRGWLPLRMVALLAGQPGLGKTTLATRLVGDVTRGALEGALAGQPADALIVSYEDAIAETLVPRLDAADADLDRVHFLGCPNGQALDLTRQLSAVDKLAAEFGARLLYIDPLVAGMPAGEVSSHRDQDVRGVLAPIAALAERRDLSVLATMHFSKSAANALLGVGGSIGFVGAARSVLVFGADPNDERGEEGPARVLAHRKCNVGRRQRSRQVAILPHVLDPFGVAIETSAAVIGDECDVTADGLVAVGERKESPKDHAVRFLRDLLADGPHRATEVYSLAEDDGIAEKTLKRAKGDLGVESYQQERVWWWRLPERQESDDDDDEDERRLW